MSLEMVPATSPEQGTQASMATLRGATTHHVTLTKSVGIFTKSTNEGGKGRGENGTTERFAARNKLHLTQQKWTTHAISLILTQAKLHLATSFICSATM